jgi:Bacterial membrane protein YfhO
MLRTVFNKHQNIFFYIILGIITILAYWPVSFHVFSLKNDALNYFLPVRHLISESINSGHLPFWTPYLNMGYALHGDMQSGVWNPFVWFFSLFGPYTLYTLQVETLLYIYLSGCGMFLLCRYLKMSYQASFLASVGYMLCGFISDSTQYLNWISGASFLPFIVCYYLRTMHEKKIKYAFLTAINLWLLFVTAYPAEFIITIYILISISLFSYKHIKGNIKSIFKLLLVILVCFSILSLPAIISYAEYLPISERGSGASFEQVMSNPLHPVSLLSFVTPLFIWNSPVLEITDGLERNSFFGSINFIFFFCSFFIDFKNRWANFCKWSFTIFLIFSFGESAILRVFAFHFLPLMNAFRHPAMAKIFFIFFASQLAGFYYNSFSQISFNLRIAQIICKILLCTMIVALLILLAFKYQYLLNNLILFPLNNNSLPNALKNLKEHIDHWTMLSFSIILQIPFLYVFLRLLKRRKNKSIIILTTINCIIHVMIFCFFTVVKKDRASFIQNVLDQTTVKNYPIPNIDSSIASDTLNDMSKFDEIGTLSMYKKKITRVDYRVSPCNLLTQNNFWFDTLLAKRCFQQYLLFYPDTIIDNTLHLDKIHQKKFALINDESFYETSHLIKNSQSEIINFSPNSISIKTYTKTDDILVYMQNYYPRWRIIMDGKKVNNHPLLVNKTFMGIPVKAGLHTIKLYYYSTDLIIATLFSIVFLLFIIMLLFIEKFHFFTTFFPSSPAKLQCP